MDFEAYKEALDAVLQRLYGVDSHDMGLDDAYLHIIQGSDVDADARFLGDKYGLCEITEADWTVPTGLED